MPTVSLADFFEGVALVSATMHPDSNTSLWETGGGGGGRASYGTRMWQGTGSIARRSQDVADVYAAKLAYLQEADVTFRVAPAWRRDLGVKAGSITSIGADRREVVLSHRAEPGEYFVVHFGEAKRSMHHVVSVSGLGHVVVPPLPFGAAADDVVSFGRCEINAELVSVTYPTYARARASDAQFTWRQVY